MINKIKLNVRIFYFPVAQASQNLGSTTSGSQQRELIAQSSEHGSPLQQAPPASSTATHKNVPVEAFFSHTASTKKPSVSERKRDILPHGCQEFEVNIICINLHSNWF